MRRDVIARLRCPYTGSAFEVKSVARECGSTIEFGVLRSDAGDFPIVAGVLRLLSDRLQAPIVDLVQQGRQEAALQAALAEKTGSERWTTWQTYRFSMPTFLP